MKKILKEMVDKMDTGNNFVYWQVTRGAGKPAGCKSPKLLAKLQKEMLDEFMNETN